MKRTKGKANKGINVEKYNRFKKIKTIKKRKEKMYFIFKNIVTIVRFIT